MGLLLTGGLVGRRGEGGGGEGREGGEDCGGKLHLEIAVKVAAQGTALEDGSA